MSKTQQNGAASPDSQTNENPRLTQLTQEWSENYIRLMEYKALRASIAFFSYSLDDKIKLDNQIDSLQTRQRQIEQEQEKLSKKDETPSQRKERLQKSGMPRDLLTPP